MEHGAARFGAALFVQPPREWDLPGAGVGVFIGGPGAVFGFATPR